MKQIKRKSKNMKLKRTIAAILAFLALASFAGCRNDKKDDPASTSAGVVAAETPENETETEAQAETATTK
jgi:outer membrane murein-binding lipoprotein Lpp